MEFIRDLPDIAVQTTTSAELDWVGMSQIEMPVQIVSRNGSVQRVPAKIEAMVSLDRSEARGIHMSRLYLLVQKAFTEGELKPQLLEQLLTDFLTSQAGLSQNAKIGIQFDVFLLRKALKSDNTGWRSYPVKIEVTKNLQQPVQLKIETLVAYSSTCPASAALARQLIQENFTQSFPEEMVKKESVQEWLGSELGITATPHAQRSYAKVEVSLKQGLDFETLIDDIEAALGTPVQAAVKREDEQQFALLNGKNLMFCEDAARKIYQALDARSNVIEFNIEVRHIESLHPHDAVSRVKKIKSPS